jgi:hypothetical protein
MMLSSLQALYNQSQLWMTLLHGMLPGVEALDTREYNYFLSGGI